MSPLATPPKRRTLWMPPVALLVLDAVAMLLLAAGLMQHYAGAESPLAGVLPEAATLPLLVLGGTLLGIGSMWAVLSVIRHHRGG